VPKEFNPNAFWFTLTGTYQYDASHSKGTIICNPCMRVAQRILDCGLVARKNTLNGCRLSELYSLHNTLDGVIN